MATMLCCEAPPFGVVILFSKQVPEDYKVWSAPAAGLKDVPHFGILEGCAEVDLLQQARWLLVEAKRKGLEHLCVLVHKDIPEYIANVGHFLSTLAGSFDGRVSAVVTFSGVPDGLKELVPPVVRLMTPKEFQEEFAQEGEVAL